MIMVFLCSLLIPSLILVAYGRCWLARLGIHTQGGRVWAAYTRAGLVSHHLGRVLDLYDQDSALTATEAAQALCWQTTWWTTPPQQLAPDPEPDATGRGC